MMRRRCASVYVSLLLLGFRVTAMGQSSASSSHPVAAGGATGRSCERRKTAGLGRADWSAGVWLSRRCNRGDGRPVAGYWNSAERQLRDEGRRDLQEVSRRDSKERWQVVS